MVQEMSIKCVLLFDVVKLVGLLKVILLCYMNNSIVLLQYIIDCIEIVICELDYCGNSLVCCFSKGGSEMFGLVFFDIINFFFVELVDVVEEVVFVSGYSLVLCIICNNLEKECQFICWLDICQVDGLLFIINCFDNGLLCKEVQCYECIVLLDEDIFGSKVLKVFVDNVQGGWIVIEKLIVVGYCYIVFVGGLDKLMSVCECYQGFCIVME